MPAAGWNGKLAGRRQRRLQRRDRIRSAMTTALDAVTRRLHRHRPRRAAARASRSGIREKLIDFGWRAVHEMTVAAKRIATAFYEAGTEADSYWNGCSAGGRQAMKEAQRFPDDFDGIVAGAPASTGPAAPLRRCASRRRWRRAEAQFTRRRRIAADPRSGRARVRRARRREGRPDRRSARAASSIPACCGARVGDATAV